MSSVNKVILIGNVGGINENNNDKFFKFSLATNEKWKDKSGELQEKTEWHSVTIFGKSVSVAQKYITKGMKIYVEGKLTTSKYEKDGETRYSTGVSCFDFKFLGGGDKKSFGNSGFGASAKHSAPKDEDISDDDIPF